MAFDLAGDTRRLRIGLLAGALLLLGMLAAVWLRSGRAEWRKTQAAFFELTGGGRHSIEILQTRNCTGQIERCTTCHLGASKRDLADKELPKEFRAHSGAMLAHLERGTGCEVCHGGTGRALDSVLAHAMPGGSKRDPMLGEPYIQAACARCHVPGATDGMQQLVAGARSFLHLGCMICHPLTNGGRGSWDFGPNLRAGGRRSFDYLKTSLLDPSANFPGSTMPSFKNYFSANPEELKDILVFLLSLGIQDQGDCAHGAKVVNCVSRPCADCHSGKAGRATGRLAHKCVYLIERSSELKCAACHPSEIPPPGPNRGRCPLVERHRANCSVCHQTHNGRNPG